MRKFGRQETKLYGIKEIALAGSIATHDGVGRGREGLNFRLLFEGTEITDGNMFDMHFERLRKWLPYNNGSFYREWW